MNLLRKCNKVMKKRDKAMQIRPNIVGWVVMTCLASFACLPQTSGIRAITSETMQVGISLDANKNLQNLLVATAPGKRVASCIGEQCIDLQSVGQVDGVQISAITNQENLSALVQASSSNNHRIIVANDDGSDSKQFMVSVTGNSANIQASPVSLPQPGATGSANQGHQTTPPGTVIPGAQPQAQVPQQGINSHIQPQAQVPQQGINSHIQPQINQQLIPQGALPHGTAIPATNVPGLPQLNPGETLNSIGGVPIDQYRRINGL